MASAHVHLPPVVFLGVALRDGGRVASGLGVTVGVASVSPSESSEGLSPTWESGGCLSVAEAIHEVPRPGQVH